MPGPRKRTLSRVVEKYVLNPPMRFALRKGLAPGNFALLETVDRRSKRPRQTPVGGHRDGGSFWLVAEHGKRSDYVKILIADPRVRVKAEGRWHTAWATQLPDDDAYRRRRQLDRFHPVGGRMDGIIFRATATEPLTIRIDLRTEAATRA